MVKAGKLLVRGVSKISQELINTKIAIAMALIKKCEELADTEGLDFSIDFNKDGPSLTYNHFDPDEEAYGENDELRTTGYYDGWQSSSYSC
jgi:hypothetical protein